MRFYFSISLFFLSVLAVIGQTRIEQWSTFEIVLNATKTYENPYTDVDAWALFHNQKGDTLKRPAFWDGGTIWKIRFAPPDFDGQWNWQSFSSNQEDKGLHLQKGSFVSIPNTSSNDLIKNGPLKMSAGHRNVIHHSGQSFLMVADTPWAIPFRATTNQVQVYAKDRSAKGFNAALLMSLQPDTKAIGPNARNTAQGFARAFADLPEGHITKMDPSYFQYLDGLIDILLENGIVPVYQPVFHGFGWKGLDVLGTFIEPEEYVRYTKYLLARYGSRPALWLIAGDNGGDDPGVKESGEMLQEWDCYQQPTGLHYSPCDDFLASWAIGRDDKHCMHLNMSHQSEPWLDFQWAQSGHDGLHSYHKVMRMYDNLPIKAVANGEPTYEGMNDGKNGLGWWQGEEAWMELMHGGTMGVVYGAAALWQWKITEDEEGWTAWSSQPKSWLTALDLEGSSYVGLLGKILAPYDLTDIEKRWDLAHGLPLLAKEGELYISYLNKGVEITIQNLPENLNYNWIDPKTGDPKQIGKVTGNTFNAPDNGPWVLIIRP